MLEFQADIQKDASFSLDSLIVNTKAAPAAHDAFGYEHMFLSVCNNGVHDSW